MASSSISPKNESNYNDLSSEEKRVIVDKGTERPGSGKYDEFTGRGLYVCKRCEAPLYSSSDKFDAHCGWPSFDDEIEGRVKRKTDADGYRTEILCANCDGHLGHVFTGEGMTPKNTRHCVNSVSLKFISAEELDKKVGSMDQSNNKAAEEDGKATAIFASGCFWGTEYFMQKADGVISTDVGYIGGHVEDPSYEEVCGGNTGHAEATRVTFDPERTDYETLCKLFFETHDPTQEDRQGPDIGEQYRTEVFYLNDEQKGVAESLKQYLQNEKGMDIATEITKATKFYKAENYHQDYYKGNGKTPYCHGYTKRFEDSFEVAE